MTPLERHTRPRARPPRRDRKRVAPIPPPFDEVITRFNQGEYRACVDPLELLFFADRNTFYQGLLHLVVALLQTRLGMVRQPRRRFASAAELLSPYAPWHRGVDVAGLLAFIPTIGALTAGLIVVIASLASGWVAAVSALVLFHRSTTSRRTSLGSG